MLEELIVRTLCDTLPEAPVDGVYLFAQTEDNQLSGITVAQHLLQEGITSKVLFVDTVAMSGYPGFIKWCEILCKRGIDKSSIEPVPPVPTNTTMLHTRIEAESLVSHAKHQGYKSIIVTAPPFHQPRAFMAAVTASVTFYPDLQLYSYPGKPLSWQQEVVHSQGKVRESRSGLIAGEVERIRKYQAKGDLLDENKVLEFMNKRDK